MSVLCILIFGLICGCECQADEPVYVLNLDSPIYVCPDENSQSFIDTSEVEIHRHNESTAYMAGIIKLLKNLEKQTIVEILVEKEASGRLELMTSLEMCDICEEVNDPDSMYQDYLKYFGFPDECPFEVGEYEVNHFVADTSELPINSANAGRYQATMNFYRNPTGSDWRLQD